MPKIYFPLQDLPVQKTPQIFLNSIRTSWYKVRFNSVIIIGAQKIVLNDSNDDGYEEASKKQSTKGKGLAPEPADMFYPTNYKPILTLDEKNDLESELPIINYDNLSKIEKKMLFMKFWVLQRHHAKDAVPIQFRDFPWLNEVFFTTI